MSLYCCTYIIVPRAFLCRFIAIEILLGCSYRIYWVNYYDVILLNDHRVLGSLFWRCIVVVMSLCLWSIIVFFCIVVKFWSIFVVVLWRCLVFNLVISVVECCIAVEMGFFGVILSLLYAKYCRIKGCVIWCCIIVVITLYLWRKISIAVH